jgi:hypothetical protein
MNTHHRISESHLSEYRQLADEATLVYFAWMKQILNLSSGSLTILIALRSQLAPGTQKATILLQISWILFALSIVLSLFALQGHHLLLIHTAQDLIQSAKAQKTNSAGFVPYPTARRKIGQIVPWIFVSAIVFLTLFGIVNLTPDTKTKPETPTMQEATVESHTSTQNEHPRK